MESSSYSWRMLQTMVAHNLPSNPIFLAVRQPESLVLLLLKNRNLNIKKGRNLPENGMRRQQIHLGEQANV